MFARGLEAFQKELRTHGFTMFVASTSYRSDVEEEQTRPLVARGADALLLIGHEREAEIYRFLETQGVPSLITWVLSVFDTCALTTSSSDSILSTTLFSLSALETCPGEVKSSCCT